MDYRSWIWVAVLMVVTACTPGETLPSYRQWQNEVKAEMSGFADYLDQQMDHDNAAIVVDIDNTALETEYHPGEPNRPVLKATLAAKERGMAVFIVTARIQSRKDDSIKELKDAGYRIDGICLRAASELKANSKQRCRKELASDGYTVTANIGNRATDFEGGYFDREFRLPDYDGELS